MLQWKGVHLARARSWIQTPASRIKEGGREEEEKAGGKQAGRLQTDWHAL